MQVQLIDSGRNPFKLPSPTTEEEYKQIRNINVWLKWTNVDEYYKVELAIEIGFYDYVYWTGSSLSISELNSLFFNACKTGNMGLVAWFIKKGVKSWELGLCGACLGGHTYLVELMITNGVEKQSASFWTRGLINACRGGHMEIVKLMIEKGANVWNGGLSNACHGGHMDIVKLMIEMGANNWNGGLSNACRGGHMEIVKLMIEKGADDWEYGLDCACECGHMDIVKLMIEKGANNWNEGFACACYDGHIDIVKLMIEKGATNLEYHIQFLNEPLKTKLIELKNQLASK